MTENKEEPVKTQTQDQKPPASLLTRHVDADGNHYLQVGIRTQSINKDVPAEQVANIFLNEGPLLLSQIAIMANQELHRILVGARVEQSKLEEAAGKGAPAAPGPKLEKQGVVENVE